MPRYRITIEYDGTAFAGWQVQPFSPSIQGALQEAVQRFSGETVVVKGAGRTDAGVHALGQVAHFDLAKEWDPFRIGEAMNFYLKPASIVILAAEKVSETFDARFSAVARHYLYRILCRRAPPALDKNRVWWLTASLDAEAMKEGAKHLLGRHDFTTFRASACQAKSPVRTLDRLEIATEGEEIRIFASARSFLHNQVRSMAGSLKLVGEGKWSPGDIRRVLEACDRTQCGAVAPAKGLYLVRVDYEGVPAEPAESGTEIEEDDD
jgi:tRNA pseudouridine38-40 synthase